jgi:hypothetical protein
VGRPRKKGDDVVRGERFRQRGGTKAWTPSHWGAYVRGYQSGQAIGRQDGLEAQPPRDERLLRVPEVMKLTGLGRTTIWQLERDGEFPSVGNGQARAVVQSGGTPPTLPAGSQSGQPRARRSAHLRREQRDPRG